jgi:biopolymer transport protein ExbD
MRFFVRKRHSAPAVIIVALIDVLIVLVIFLLVTATFKQQEPALKLVLPQSSHAQQAGTGDDTTLVVSIDAKGGFRFGDHRDARQ